MCSRTRSDLFDLQLRLSNLTALGRLETYAHDSINLQDGSLSKYVMVCIITHVYTQFQKPGMGHLLTPFGPD